MTTLITREELHSKIQAGAVTVVDALAGDYYKKRHLPTAIALHESEVDELATGLLPDKDAAIVTYCSDSTCPNSQQLADRLTSLGYTNVSKYREGIQDWVEAGLPVEQS